MEILESRINNHYAIASVEKWLDLDLGSLGRYYLELINDKQLLAIISDAIAVKKNYKEDLPGLFNRTPIENVDWYGLQRILLYCFVRLFNTIGVEKSDSFILAPLMFNSLYCVIKSFTVLSRLLNFSCCGALNEKLSNTTKS